MYVAIFIVALILAVILHEFGHFATAKAFGMKVDKFFVGFGPTLWSFRRGETEYGFKGIPAGGFVRIVGMNHFEEVDPADVGRTFRDKPPWQRFVVLVAGVVTHLIIAWVLLIVALAAVPIARPVEASIVGSVLEETPAAEVDLQAGDRITAIDDIPVRVFEDISAALADKGGETVEITYVRDGEERTVSSTVATELPNGERRPFLGIRPEGEVGTLAFGEAVREASVGELSVPVMLQQTVGALGSAFNPAALGRWFSSIGGEGERDPNGPVSLVGVGRAVEQVGDQGDLFAVMAIFAQLNLVLAFFNILPLPPFDGGHVAVLVVEETVNRIRRVRGRGGDWHIDPSVITPLALAVIVFFVVVSLTALYADIVDPINLTGG